MDFDAVAQILRDEISKLYPKATHAQGLELRELGGDIDRAVSKANLKLMVAARINLDEVTAEIAKNDPDAVQVERERYLED